MNWVTVTEPTRCRRCQWDVPAGERMATFTLGPLALARCAACEREVAAQIAKFEADRRNPIRFQSEPSATVADQGFTRVSAMQRPRRGVVPYNELPEQVRRRESAIAGRDE